MLKMRVGATAAVCYLHGCFPGARPIGRQSTKGSEMMTKVCSNSKCPAYAHFVYTVGMRCVLCRCDLMPAHRNTDVAIGVGSTPTRVPTELSRKADRAHAVR
jgi:hypothetical protein